MPRCAESTITPRSDARAADTGFFYNDRAELLPKVRPDLESWNDTGFLVWDPRNQAEVDDPHTPIGSREANLGDFTGALAEEVSSVGENGCGYEGSLEAWYRFLIDPAPVTSMSMDTATSRSVRGPINAAVLAQRAAFLGADRRCREPR